MKYSQVVDRAVVHRGTKEKWNLSADELSRSFRGVRAPRSCRDSLKLDASTTRYSQLTETKDEPNDAQSRKTVASTTTTITNKVHTRSFEIFPFDFPVTSISLLLCFVTMTGELLFRYRKRNVLVKRGTFWEFSGETPPRGAPYL